MTISYKHRNNTFKNSNGDNVTHKDILLKVDGVEQVLSTPLIVTGVGSLLSKTDDGFKEVDVVATELNEFTNAPQLRIANPWWTGDTLVCEWTNNEWVCDLD